MKKILIATGIFFPEIGGPASYARAVAEKLSGEFTVTILTFSNVFSLADDKSKSYKVIRVWRKWPWLMRHLLYGFRLIWLARSCDVVLALNAISAGWWASIGSRLLKKIFFVRIPGDYAWEVGVNSQRTSLLLNDFQKVPKHGWLGFLHWLQHRACQKAERVIVPSEYLADIVEGWGIDRGKISVVYNGVDFIPATLSKEEARKTIGIPGTLIVSAGRLVTWKGFRMLIKIMPQLLQINQFFRLVIVGDGPDRPILEAMIHNLGLGRKVYLVGKKSPQESAVYLAATDVFVLNSGYEGFSHQILEAMTAGAPVIASAVGGNYEIIQQGENGLLVKYNDEFNLVEAIRSVWSLSELREKFIEQGKETVKKFSIERMVRETVQLFSYHV